MVIFEELSVEKDDFSLQYGVVMPFTSRGSLDYANQTNLDP